MTRLDKDHKVRIENCKGTLKEPRASYGKWAYWYARYANDPDRRGWYSVPDNETLPASKKPR